MLILHPAFPLLAVYRGSECTHVPEACTGTLPNTFSVQSPPLWLETTQMAPKWSAKPEHILIGKHRAAMKMSKLELRKHGLSKHSTER